MTIDGSAGRSYRLTSDLSVGNANIDGLFLTTSRITIDFNGFSLDIFGIGSGSGGGIAGSGINGSVAGFTTIKNGVIRAARSTGIRLAGAKGVRVENMTLDFNLGGAMHLGLAAQIVRNRSSDNGGGTNSAIVAGDGSLISENVVIGSGMSGISCGDGCTVTQNTVSESGGSGIFVGLGATVSGNTAFNNDGDGITATDGSNVSGNTASNNGELGLDLTGLVSYRENVMVGNTTGGVSSGINRGGNYCSGTGVTSFTCP